MMFSGCFRREAKYYRIDMRDNADTTIRKGFPMSIRFAIRGDHIQLDQLLKATGLADSGGNAHAAISERAGQRRRRGRDPQAGQAAAGAAGGVCGGNG
jgi:hypothetical protein